ncbi:hypothetical protein ACVWY3_000506 [Bradyrhizobium sp. USDA 4486]
MAETPFRAGLPSFRSPSPESSCPVDALTILRACSTEGRFDLLPLLVVALLLSLGAFVQGRTFGLDRGHPLLVLPPGFVKDRQRLGGRLLPTLALPRPGSSSLRRSASRRFRSLSDTSAALRASLSLILGADRFFGFGRFRSRLPEPSPRPRSVGSSVLAEAAARSRRTPEHDAGLPGQALSFVWVSYVNSSHGYNLMRKSSPGSANNSRRKLPPAIGPAKRRTKRMSDTLWCPTFQQRASTSTASFSLSDVRSAAGS